MALFVDHTTLADPLKHARHVEDERRGRQIRHLVWGLALINHRCPREGRPVPQNSPSSANAGYTTYPLISVVRSAPASAGMLAVADPDPSPIVNSTARKTFRYPIARPPCP